MSLRTGNLHWVKTETRPDKGASLIGVERTARILSAVAEAESGNLTEISRRTELNEATVLRYLNSLASLGYVERFNAAQYRRLIVTQQHGEIGPVLAVRGHAFTGPADIPATT